MNIIKGTPISSGIAIGKVLIKKSEINEIIFQSKVDSENEKTRFEAARLQAIEQVEKIYVKMRESKGEKEAAIFSAHISMLEDIELIEGVEAAIDELKCQAEWALKIVSLSFIEIFEAMDSAYMKERATDVKDIGNRIQSILSGTEATCIFDLKDPVILVAKELTPSDTADLNPELVLGIVNEVGGQTSHAAIIARMLGVPLVVYPEIIGLLSDDQMMIFDGSDGTIYMDPAEEVLQKYKHMQAELRQKKAQLEKLKGTKAITLDGFEIQIAGNIGTPKNVKKVLEQDGQGIGLFRTEFLYMSRDQFPDEEEQFEAYKEVAEQIKDQPIVIRTLDIGGDKALDYLEIPKEMNPFLGCRAIRFCLNKVSLWKVQLRAMLRASMYGNIHMMFPMIATLDELFQAKEILEQVKDELRREGIPFNQNMPVGMMMETPAAAVMADIFAGEVDFFSIGTNDLIQYTLAVDRMNSEVAHLYSQYDPAVLRLIKKIVDSGHEAGIWVGMCGEAAADRKLIPLWVGIGLDELSMSPLSILETKEQIQGLSQKKAISLVKEIMSLKTATDIEQRLEVELETTSF